MKRRDLLAGRYELRGVLGRGGMAEVRDGWDTRLHRPVAVKLSHPAVAADPAMRRRFEDEARAAAALNHPNIVAVHDFGHHDAIPYIVMERLPGRTLADELAAGPMPVPRVRGVLHDVLAALAVAHEVGILHRDIKPGNILVAGGTVKLADFGIAKTAGVAHTATGLVLGTVGYLSPQRVAGAPATVADDLYAVGVLGYEALTGRPPFPLVTGSVRAVRPDADPALAAAIERATAHDPGARFGGADEMRAALTRPATKVLAAPVPPSESPFVPRKALRRRMSRERKLLVAAAGVVALVVGVLALATDPSSTPTSPTPTSALPPPPTSAPPPPPTSAPPAPPPPPVVEAPKPPRKRKPGPGNGRGNGPGHGEGPGNKKRN